VDEYLRQILQSIGKYFPDLYITEIGMDQDHIHLRVIIPPKYAVSRIVDAIKTNTSRIIRKRFSGMLGKVYWDNGGIWGTGFYVSTVGGDEAVIREYVRQQGRHDEEQREELKKEIPRP